MTDLSPAVAANLASLAELRQYQAAVTQYTQETQFQNPDSGLMERRSPQLPPFVVDAMKRAGMPLPAQPSAVSPAGQPAPSSAPTPAPTASAVPSRSIWSMKGNVTGPIPAAVETATRTPVVGGFVPQNRMIQDRTFLLNQTNSLVRVLQNNPRFSEGERKQIREEFSLDPKVFDTQEAFTERLIGIDEALIKRQDDAYKTAFGPNRAFVSKDERQHSMDVFNAVAQFREALAIPPRMKAEEVRKAVKEGKMRSGDEFLTTDGRVKVVP